MNIKVDFDNIVVKEDKNDFNVKVLMLKGEKGEAGATSWGAITGTLSNQTDLKNALDGKANQSDFNTVSGQVNTNTSNIGTINGQITSINGELDDFEDLFYGNATVNDENTSITLENTVEAEFEKFDLKGNTTQDGTPTPSSPIPVNVVSGDNSITISNQSGTDSNTYNIDLPNGMELCKIGNYQDYFYKDSGKWYLYKEIGKKVLNGTETWILQSTKTSGYNRFRVEVGDNLVNTSSSNVLPMYCNKLSVTSPDGTFLRTQGIASDSNANHYFNVYIEDVSTYTLANFKTWLSSNNLEVHYILATPTNTEITYQPLIEQLNAIEEATSKENQTNINQVNNDLPFIIYAEAFANTFNGRIEGLDYKIDNCELSSNKSTTINSSSTDTEYPSAKAVYDLFNSITDGDEVSY